MLGFCLRSVHVRAVIQTARQGPVLTLRSNRDGALAFAHLVTEAETCRMLPNARPTPIHSQELAKGHHDKTESLLDRALTLSIDIGDPITRVRKQICKRKIPFVAGGTFRPGGGRWKSLLAVVGEVSRQAEGTKFLHLLVDQLHRKLLYFLLALSSHARTKHSLSQPPRLLRSFSHQTTPMLVALACAALRLKRVSSALRLRFSAGKYRVTSFIWL